MKNSKNRKSYRMIAMLLILTLLSTVALTGTFAKYTSKFQGSDTALVAKWDINVEAGGKELKSETQTLDLFKHAYKENLVGGAGQDRIISPGVDGSFDLLIENKSDVAADITLTVENTKKLENLPIEYSIEQEGTVIHSSIKTVADLQKDLTTIFNKKLDVNEKENVTVKWAWEFDKAATQNTTDTNLGIESVNANRSVYALDIMVSAVQAKPGE